MRRDVWILVSLVDCYVIHVLPSIDGTSAHSIYSIYVDRAGHTTIASSGIRRIMIKACPFNTH